MGERILVVDDSRTIRRVVTSILERHEYEAVAAEDGEKALEALRDGGADLVLLDFVMPRMNGYQFCRELRADDTLKNLPVVLMSAKGDKIRGQFVQQTGALDAITKPFDARGLLAVVQGALRKQQEGRARPVPDAAAMPEDEEDVGPESLRPGPLTLSGDPALRRVQQAAEVALAISRLIVPALRLAPGVNCDNDRPLTEAITRAVTPDNMGELSSLLKLIEFGEDSREVLSGDLSVISIAEILQLLEMQRRTGALTLAKRGAEVTLHMREGLIDLANSRGMRDEFLLGRYLVKDGALSRDELDDFIANRSNSQRLLGVALSTVGLASDGQVRQALAEQTSELVYEVVRWTSGRFSFIVGAEAPAAAEAKLGLSAGAAIMEGFRRVDEWRLIEGSFDFADVLQPDPMAIERARAKAKLTEKELEVLNRIDGKRKVSDIVDSSEGNSFDVCKIIYQLLNSRVVRKES